MDTTKIANLMATLWPESIPREDYDLCGRIMAKVMEFRQETPAPEKQKVTKAAKPNGGGRTQALVDALAQKSMTSKELAVRFGMRPQSIPAAVFAARKLGHDITADRSKGVWRVVLKRAA